MKGEYCREGMNVRGVTGKERERRGNMSQDVRTFKSFLLRRINKWISHFRMSKSYSVYEGNCYVWSDHSLLRR